MKKFLIALVAWISKPFLRQPESTTGVSEAEELRAKLIELQDRLATAEAMLKTAQAGNKALQDFISARHKPDKVLTEPPKIVKPFAVLVIAALTLYARAQFPPPYVHNYWDTNANPIVMTVSNGIIVTNMTADVRGSQFFGFRLGTTAVPYPFMFETAATTDRLRGTNAVTHDWIDFNDGIDLGNLANNRVIMLHVSNGDVSATTFTGSGATLTALPALATMYPQAVTNNDTRSISILGIVTAGAFTSTTNSATRWSAITMPGNVNNVSYFTNTSGYTIWYALKGTGITVGLTTVSTFPTVQAMPIMATTQGFFPLSPQDVVMATNTTITQAQSRPLP